MDQSTFQNNDFYQQPQQTPYVEKNAAYYRAQARKKLKPVYWMAVLATLIASLLGAVIGGVTALSDAEIKIEDGKIEVQDEYVIDGMELVEALDDRDFGAIFEASPWMAVIFGAVAGAAVVSLLLTLFVGAPVTLGYRRYLLNVIDEKNADTVSVLFDYFKTGYAKSVGLRLLHGLINFAVGLPMTVTSLALVWSNRRALVKVLFKAPVEAAAVPAEDYMAVLVMGCIIVAVAILTVVLSIWVNYRYYYAYTVMAEYPEIGVLDAMRNSANLMRGNKWKLFCLQISFIGWSILAQIVPVGVLFLNPYFCTATTAFYDEIANRSAARETEFPSLNPDDYFVD